MLDDKTRALLGDRAAQERLTEAGVLLPCSYCGGMGELINSFGSFDVICEKYGCRGNSYSTSGDDGGDLYFETEYDARLAWNTRAPILNSEEMEMLEGME